MYNINNLNDLNDFRDLKSINKKLENINFENLNELIEYENEIVLLISKLEELNRSKEISSASVEINNFINNLENNNYNLITKIKNLIKNEKNKNLYYLNNFIKFLEIESKNNN